VNALFRPGPHPLIACYDALVASGAIERDPAQTKALAPLEALSRQLATPTRAHRPGLVGRALSHIARAKPQPRAGVYLWGEVGRGKTMLMDLFFETAAIHKKRRAHFHSFMAETHTRLHEARLRRDDDADPVMRVARDFAAETRLLCFDEFSVTDIADATILSRLFSAFFASGVAIVATSNVAPQRLYEGGRNRDLFLPFIALLEERMEIVELGARADFRLEKERAGDVYFAPANDAARRKMDALFHALSKGRPGAPQSLRVNGRALEAPCVAGRVARFSFHDLCARPLGAADYMALAKKYDAIFLDDAPRLDYERRNEAKRFITLVDVLYETRKKLIMSAECAAEDLYRAERGAEAMEYARTASRLIEMRSRDYLAGVELETDDWTE
jgi:cell division protein ZapE